MWRTLGLAGALLLAVLRAPELLAQPGRRSSEPEITSVHDVEDARLERLTFWVEAVERHEPGLRDDAFRIVHAWTNEQLDSLDIDIGNLLAVMAKPTTRRFFLRSENRRVEHRYTAAQRAKMGILACAATATLEEPQCLKIRANRADAALLRLAARSAAAIQTGDTNYLLRRGAMLHTDILAMSGLGFSLAATFDLADGRVAGTSTGSHHVDIATRLLDQIVPPGETKPAPARDRMVRDWYVATSAWMEAREKHSVQLLNRGLRLFPEDAELLFLAGCQHEDLATPSVQEPASLLRGRGVTLAIESEVRELRQAEAFLRRALAVAPDPAVRLRLAHVLLSQGRYAEASRELEPTPPTLSPEHRYYAALFAGTADEGLGRYDAARASYEQAAALFPVAPAPYFALSELASRLGHDGEALRVLDRMFALAPGGRDDEPWWKYYHADVADPDAPLKLFRRHFEGAR